MRPTRRHFSFLLAGLAVVGAWALAMSVAGPRPGTRPVRRSATADAPAAAGEAVGEAVGEAAYAHGPAAAPIIVRAFSDYQCPFCGEQERRHGAALEAPAFLGDSIRFEFYDLVLPSHAHAAAAARAARCAGAQGRYPEAKAALFAQQDAWLDAGDPAAAAAAVVREVSPDAPALATCLADPARGEAAARAARRNLRYGVAVGLEGTPSYLIEVAGRRTMLSGVQSPAAVGDAIRALRRAP